MRLAGRMLSIVGSGNDHDEMVTTVISGVAVKRPAPSFDRFEPAFSRWVDVTERAPWGVGARLPLIPFRVLAHNARTETPLYLKTVYIEQLDGVRLPTGEVHNGMCVIGDCGSMARRAGSSISSSGAATTTSRFRRWQPPRAAQCPASRSSAIAQRRTTEVADEAVRLAKMMRSVCRSGRGNARHAR